MVIFFFLKLFNSKTELSVHGNLKLGAFIFGFIFIFSVRIYLKEAAILPPSTVENRSSSFF